MFVEVFTSLQTHSDPTLFFNYGLFSGELGQRRTGQAGKQPSKPESRPEANSISKEKCNRTINYYFEGLRAKIFSYVSSINREECFLEPRLILAL